MSSNIQVFVRCRPLVKSEVNIPVPIEVHPELSKIIVRDTGSDKSSVKTFTYDKVFSSDASQAEIYSEIVSPLVEEVIQGFNCTIFAYGQTGTGKTFTIEGDRRANSNEKSYDHLSGIIPRSMKHLFNKLSGQNLKYDICVSFLELYNEDIFDLLSKHEDLVKLRMYENSSQKGSVIVQGLEIVAVKSMDEVYDILEKGCKRRRKAVTLINKASSRSHTIFTVTVSIKESSATLEKVKNGKLNLVDLAGSENIGRSGAINKRAKEAGNINQSLLALGRVITSLCEKAVHIPYRESKLTRLLQDSLGGQTKTAVIATISPSAMHMDETLNTLEYALRAKSITNKPELNAQLTVNSIVKDYLEEINTQRKALYEMGKTNGVYVPEETIRNWKSHLEAKREKFELMLEVKRLAEEDNAMDCTILELEKRLEEKENLLAVAKANNEEFKVESKKAKEENKLLEVMLDTMEPMYDCMHEKYHKILEEIKILDLEARKRKEAVAEALKEQKKAREELTEIRLNHNLWDEKFRQDSEKLLNSMRNINDSVNLMTTECKSQVSVLKNGFDARKSDCEKAFHEASKAIFELETINNNFQQNVDVSLLEERSGKLKFIEDVEKEYSSSNKASSLAQLNQIINHCEYCLLELSSSANEWKNVATSEMETWRKMLKEHTDNIQSTFESTAADVKEILNKQKENLEEFSNIVSESLNVENTSKKVLNEKFLAVEQAVSSLDIYCTEVNENAVDKTKRTYSCLTNYLDLGREIVEKLSNYGENCSKNIGVMHTGDDQNVPTIFFEKRENLKMKEVSAFSKYKKLIEELNLLTKSDKNFCGIRDSVIQLLKDVDEQMSNEQIIMARSVQMMADTIKEKGNNLLSCLVKNHTEVEAALSKDKLNMETLVESSKRLSKMTLSEISDCHQFLEIDLRRFELKSSEGHAAMYEENACGSNTVVSDRTLRLSNAAAELTLPSEGFVPDMECTACFRQTDHVFKDDSFSALFSNDPLKDKTLQGASNSFMSSSTISPVTRPRNKNAILARKNLLFPDVEKLTNELVMVVFHIYFEEIRKMN